MLGLKKQFDKQLLKVMSVNSVAITIRILSGLILSKLTANSYGPKGIGLLGNSRSFLSTLETLGSLGFYRGIVNYIAEFKDNDDELSKIISSAIFFCFINAIICIGILFYFDEYFSKIIFDNDKHTYLIKITAIGLFFYSINRILTAVVNGLELYKTYNLINIVATVLSFLCSLYIVLKFNFDLYLLITLLIPAFVFIITLVFSYPKKNILKLLSVSSIELKYIKKLSDYSLMALVATLLVPPVLIAIRNHIIQVDGIDNMGYWEAMNRISNYLTLFVTSILSLYFYPKLVGVKNDKKEFKKEFFLFVKTLFPIVLGMLLALYLSKQIIIEILFNKSFTNMIPLFKWQLMGDFFKYSSYVMGYIFYIKKLTKLFIITEICSVIIKYVLSLYFINSYGYEGASIAYLAHYFFYFLFLSLLFKKELFS